MLVSTAVGGYMVEIARASASSGRLTSVRNAVEQVSYIISGVVSGYLAGIQFGWTTIACGAVAFLLFPVALVCLREAPAVQQNSRQILSAAGQNLSKVFAAKALWMAAAVSLLFYFAPGTQTAQFFAQQNDLHLTTQQQGNLLSMNGVFGVLSAFLYGAFAAKRFQVRRLLFACIIIGASGQAAYAFYNSYGSALIVDSYWGFAYTLAEVAMMHLAVRATPVGCEAMGFALMMAVRNFGLYGGDWIGAAIQDHFHLTFHALALINAAGSLLALPIVLMLPASIAAGRDARIEDLEKVIAVDTAAVQAHGGTG